MSTEAADKTIPVEIRTLQAEERVVLRQTSRAVTPFGGISVFVTYLCKIEFVATVRKHMPIQLTSPNHIDPASTLLAFMISVLAGARRFAHANLLRGDKALLALLDIKRFATDDTIRNLFSRFNMGHVHTLFTPLREAQMERLPLRQEGYSLDLDSTVFERNGQQEGALKGYNPRKRGRPSHHPLLAILDEAHFVLNGWLRSGNCASANGVVEFLKEALAQWGQRQKIRMVRADSGFFDNRLLCYLEAENLSYIVVARLTKFIKREAQRIQDWRVLDEVFSVGEFRLQLLGWDKCRRFVVVREREGQRRESKGRKLIEVPGYTFRVFVTSCEGAPEELWRDYNKRANMENRIAELKHDLAADKFCMKQFFATEAAFQAILVLFNLLGEFQRAIGNERYSEPATLRAHVFTCGAILGRAGRRLVLYLASGWGGLDARKLLIENILRWTFPTSPKLVLQLAT